MSVLTGPEILRMISSGSIKVDPFVEDHIGPNSLDLTLGNNLKIYVDDSGVPIDHVYREALQMYGGGSHAADERVLNYLEERGALLDLRKRPNTKTLLIPESGIVLMPGRGYLGSTVEFVGTREFVPQIHGRSSMGRMFFKVHETAGWGDLGFEGTWTLEISVMHPLRVYPNTRICQIAFEEVVGDKLMYNQRTTSKYHGQVDPIESHSYRDFEK